MKQKITCHTCKQQCTDFTSIPSNAGWIVTWNEICETCAESSPDFYYRYIDMGGSYRPFEGTKEEVEANLSRILEREGRTGLARCEVYLVPGKYRHQSDDDKRRFGQRVNIKASVSASVKIN